MEGGDNLGTIVIDRNYGYVLMAIAGIALQCFGLGFVVNFARKRIYNREFMREHFSEEHKMNFGRGIGPMGYPDTGSGRYSQKLSYRDWYDFNLTQRAHLNFTEQIGVIIPLLLVSGLFFPKLTAFISWFYFFGRLIYFFQYRSEGPRGRVLGAACFFTSIISSGLLTIIGALDLVG